MLRDTRHSYWHANRSAPAPSELQQQHSEDQAASQEKTKLSSHMQLGSAIRDNLLSADDLCSMDLFNYILCAKSPVTIHMVSAGRKWRHRSLNQWISWFSLTFLVSVVHRPKLQSDLNFAGTSWLPCQIWLLCVTTAVCQSIWVGGFLLENKMACHCMGCWIVKISDFGHDYWNLLVKKELKCIQFLVGSVDVCDCAKYHPRTIRNMSAKSLQGSTLCDSKRASMQRSFLLTMDVHDRVYEMASRNVFHVARVSACSCWEVCWLAVATLLPVLW